MQVRAELRSVQGELSLELEQCQGQLELANSLVTQQTDRLEELEEQVAELSQREIREDALQVLDL